MRAYDDDDDADDADDAVNEIILAMPIAVNFFFYFFLIVSVVTTVIKFPYWKSMINQNSLISLIPFH